LTVPNSRFRIAGMSHSRRIAKMSRSRRGILVGLAFVFGLPIGFAGAQAVGPEESEPTAGKPASACPEAASAFEKAGSPVDYFIPDCPSAEHVEAVTKPTAPPDSLLDQCEDLLKRAENELCSGALKEYRP
jgi:hypothetical protein